MGAFALPTWAGSGSLLSADEQASSTSERQALKGATMNTVAMVQARDQPSLLDQQEKASALELRLKVVRDVMQKFQSAPEGMTESMALLAREIDGPEASDDMPVWCEVSGVCECMGWCESKVESERLRIR